MEATALLHGWYDMESMYREALARTKELTNSARQTDQKAKRIARIVKLNPANATPEHRAFVATFALELPDIVRSAARLREVLPVLSVYLDAVRDAVNALPEPERTIITLHYRDRVSWRALKRASSMSSGRLRDTLNAGVELLRQHDSKDA